MGQRMQLEQEGAANNQTIAKEEEDSYRQTMVLEKGKEFDNLNQQRHDRDLK